MPPPTLTLDITTTDGLRNAWWNGGAAPTAMESAPRPEAAQYRGWAMSSPADAWNMRLVGQTDLNGHGDCMHVNLKDHYAFVAHMGESRVGTSVVDIADPR